MSTTEIKQSLIKSIGALKGKELREVQGLLMNYVNAKTLSWDDLSQRERSAIEEGVKQLDAGKGISHKKVISKIRKRYSK